jgi:hypothetical protein
MVFESPKPSSHGIIFCQTYLVRVIMDKLTVQMERQLQISYEAAQDSIDAYVGGLSAALRAAEQAIPKPNFRIAEIKRRLVNANNARRDLNAHANDRKYLDDVDKLYAEKKADFDYGLIVFAGDVEYASQMAARVLQN